MMSKKMMYILAVGAVAWFVLKRRRQHEEMMELEMKKKSAELPKPTDSMMPGSIEPAIHSVIKQRNGTLECLSCY